MQLSNCCSAPFIIGFKEDGERCSACKEHCGEENVSIVSKDDMLEVGGYETHREMAFSINNGEEVIRIVKGKFYWRGEEVTDKYQIYERFNDWLTKAERYE